MGGQRVWEGNRQKANSTGFKRSERIKNAAVEYGFLETPDQRELIERTCPGCYQYQQTEHQD